MDTQTFRERQDEHGFQVHVDFIKYEPGRQKSNNLPNSLYNDIVAPFDFLNISIAVLDIRLYF